MDITQKSTICNNETVWVEDKRKKNKCLLCNYACEKPSALKVHVESVHEGKNPISVVYVILVLVSSMH